MKKVKTGQEVFKYTLSVVILGLGVGVAIFLATFKKDPQSADSVGLITVADAKPVQRYEGPLDLEVSGVVVPFREIEIAAQVGGLIKTKYPDCEAGQYVTKGTKLFEIDTADFELDKKTIESEIVQAQRSLEEVQKEIEGSIKNLELAQEDFDLQKRDFERTSRLSSALSASELDQARRVLLQSQSAVTSSKNAFETLNARELKMQASLDLAQSRLAKAVLNLERTTVKAPDNGVIVEEFVEQGNYATPGTKLVSMEVTRNAEVQSNLTPGELRWLRRNADVDTPFQDEEDVLVYQLPKIDVEIFENSNPNVKWRGVLERFNGIGRDQVTKTIPCSIVVEKPIILTDDGPHVLVRGMYVKCRMEIPRSKLRERKFLELPASAVQPYLNDQGESGDAVWVAGERQADIINKGTWFRWLDKFPVEIVHRFERKVEGVVQEFVVVEDDGKGTGLTDDSLVIESPLPNPRQRSQQEREQFVTDQRILQEKMKKEQDWKAGRIGLDPGQVEDMKISLQKLRTFTRDPQGKVRLISETTKTAESVPDGDAVGKAKRGSDGELKNGQSEGTES
ncbi:MAG: hypothetical protein MK106_08750 [Mariniblastus sp.]|nr:hypothetical protein [Mariniblastus sp.]